jgi:GNAT superfamily N-acetyltransferase
VEFRAALDSEAEDVARLRWESASDEERERCTSEEFVGPFIAWMRASSETHTAFVAHDGQVVGMAWLAALPRTPGPGALERVGGDLQTVYVVPQARGRGVGEQLVRAVLAHAWQSGMHVVTVSSGRRARALYQRIGFVAEPTLLRIRPEGVTG